MELIMVVCPTGEQGRHVDRRSRGSCHHHNHHPALPCNIQAATRTKRQQTACEGKKKKRIFKVQDVLFKSFNIPVKGASTQLMKNILLLLVSSHVDRLVLFAEVFRCLADFCFDPNAVKVNGILLLVLTALENDIKKILVATSISGNNVFCLSVFCFQSNLQILFH